MCKDCRILTIICIVSVNLRINKKNAGWIKVLLYSYRKALCIWNINYMFWAGEQSQDNSQCLCKCIFNIAHSMKLHMNFPPLVLCWQKVWGFKMFQGFSICTKVALTCAIFSPLIKRTLGYTHEAPFVASCL